jgi:hypothetical protein
MKAIRSYVTRGVTLIYSIQLTLLLHFFLISSNLCLNFAMPSYSYMHALKSEGIALSSLFSDLSSCRCLVAFYIM